MSATRAKAHSAALRPAGLSLLILVSRFAQASLRLPPSSSGTRFILLARGVRLRRPSPSLLPRTESQALLLDLGYASRRQAPISCAPPGSLSSQLKMLFPFLRCLGNERGNLRKFRAQACASMRGISRHPPKKEKAKAAQREHERSELTSNKSKAPTCRTRRGLTS